QWGNNWFFPNNGASVTLGTGDMMGSSNPFVNWAAQDVRLNPAASGTLPINAGRALSGLDTVDMAGNTRGADGAWDIGALEYTDGSTVTPTPTSTPTPTPTATATPTPTPTPTVTPSTDSTLGTTSILSSTDSGCRTYLVAYRATLAQASVVTTLNVNVVTASGTMRLGIYADNSGVPGALMATTPAFVPAVGWNSVAVTDQNVTLAAGTYWLAFETDTDALVIAATSTGGAHVYKSNWTYQSLPSTFPTISGTGTWNYSLYAGFASPTPTPTPTPVPTATPTPTPTPTPVPTATPTPTPTPVPVSTVTMGVDTVLGKSDAKNKTYTLASKVELTQSATLKSISAYIKTASGNMRMAVYRDNSGRPGALVAQTNAFATKVGWNTVPVTDQTQVLTAGCYWLAFEVDNNTVSIAAASTGGAYVYKSNWTYQPFPSTYPTISGSGYWNFSIYATLAAEADATATPTPTPTPAATATPAPTTFTLGQTSILSGTDSGMASYLVAYRVSLAEAAVVNALNIHIKTPSGTMRLGIYADSSGKPGALMATTDSFTPVAGWNTASVTAPATLEAGAYWLAMEATSNTLVLSAASTGGSHAYRSGWAYTTLPSTFPTLSGTGTWQYSFYAGMTSLLGG
ncbi:MAG: hypothetical protein ABFD69_08985, partial [Candidatus Sumerlaeia bacterium]